MNAPANPMPRLGERGQIFVSMKAAEVFAKELSAIDGRKWLDEESRRYLTELLIDGRIASEDETPWKIRARSNKSGLDVSAMVARQGRLLIVVSAHVREYR